MKIITLTQLSKPDKIQLLELWNNEYPKKLNYNSLQDLDDYLSGLTNQSHTLILNNSDEIVGWYFDFIRDNQKWFAIILDAKIQGKGFGTLLLNKAKEKEQELNGWVIDHNHNKKLNGETYQSPLAFYLTNGFSLIKQSRLKLEHISAVKIKWSK